MNVINNSRVNTTNDMLKAQNKRYYKYNTSRLESKPIFCTYFNADRSESTISKGLGAVYDKSGKNSPLRFNQINNVPLYGFREFNRETNKTEYKGVSVELSNESILVGGTGFEPNVSDFILIEISGAKLVFEVSLATPTTVLANPSFRIAYSFKFEANKDPNMMEEIMSQVINEYDFIVDNVGTNKTAVLDVTTVKNINELTYIFQRINASYKETFYRENENVLSFTEVTVAGNDTYPLIVNYYCPAMVEFQIRNRPIMYRFDNSGTLELLLTHETMGYYEYDKTPYGAISYVIDNKLVDTPIFNVDDLKSTGKYGSNLIREYPRQRYLTALNNMYRDDESVVLLNFMSDKHTIELIKEYRENIDRKAYQEVHKVNIDDNSSIFAILEKIQNGDVLSCRNELTSINIENTLEYFLYCPIILMVLKLKIIEMQLSPKSLIEDIPTITRK